MQFEDVLKARHSVRLFENTPVERALLETIIQEAQTAPSWVNAQERRVWTISGQPLETMRKEHAAKDRAGVKGYSETPVTHRDQFSEAAQENMRVFNERREAAGVAQVKLESQAELFHAPLIVYLTIPKKRGDFALFDLGALSQTLMLAAANHGVGSVVAYNLVKYPDLIRQYVPIPESEEIVIGIALGYEKKHPLNDFRSTRVPTASILTVVD